MVSIKWKQRKYQGSNTFTSIFWIEGQSTVMVNMPLKALKISERHLQKHDKTGLKLIILAFSHLFTNRGKPINTFNQFERIKWF